MFPQQLAVKMVGSWQGTCKTWFKPNELADESLVNGLITEVFAGRFLRHVYQGAMQGNPRCGEELIAHNAIAKRFEVAWIDDFHMNYAILFSAGPVTATGFTVSGEFDVGEGVPKWGWRTEYDLRHQDRMIITAFNVSPEGAAARAVETDYRRVP